MITWSHFFVAGPSREVRFESSRRKVDGCTSPTGLRTIGFHFSPSSKPPDHRKYYFLQKATTLTGFDLTTRILLIEDERYYYVKVPTWVNFGHFVYFTAIWYRFWVVEKFSVENGRTHASSASYLATEMFLVDGNIFFIFG
jgi:hypothetical protein